MTSCRRLWMKTHGKNCQAVFYGTNNFLINIRIRWTGKRFRRTKIYYGQKRCSKNSVSKSIGTNFLKRNINAHYSPTIWNVLSSIGIGTNYHATARSNLRMNYSIVLPIIGIGRKLYTFHHTDVLFVHCMVWIFCIVIRSEFRHPNYGILRYGMSLSSSAKCRLRKK